MLIGATLPQFGGDPEAVVSAARQAEDAGVDGVFLFDHLWPLGGRDRPFLATWPLLGAIATETSSVRVGTLVARVGVVSNAALALQLATADRLASGRLIAGLGTGDALSAAENEAFGLPAESVADRVDRLRAVGTELVDRGIEVWFAGRHHLVQSAAAAVGVAVNLWAAEPDEVAEAVSAGHTVTWGGQVAVGQSREEADAIHERFGPRDGLIHGTTQEVAEQLQRIADAGATWAVCSPLDSASPTVALRLAEVRSLLD